MSCKTSNHRGADWKAVFFWGEKIPSVELGRLMIQMHHHFRVKKGASAPAPAPTQAAPANYPGWGLVGWDSWRLAVFFKNPGAKLGCQKLRKSSSNGLLEILRMCGFLWGSLEKFGGSFWRQQGGGSF